MSNITDFPQNPLELLSKSALKIHQKEDLYGFPKKEALKYQDERIKKLFQTTQSLTIKNLPGRKRFIEKEIMLFNLLKASLLEKNQNIFQLTIENYNKALAAINQKQAKVSIRINTTCTVFSLLSMYSLKKLDLFKNKFLAIQVIKICKYFNFELDKFLSIWRKAKILLEIMQNEKQYKYRNYKDLNFSKHWDPFLREKKLKKLKLMLFVKYAYPLQNKNSRILALEKLTKIFNNCNFSI